MSGWQTLQQALARGRGRERAFKCPSHDDRSASASVNVVKGLWTCYACGAHGTVDDVIEADDVRFGDDIEELLGYEQRVYSESWLDQYEHHSVPVHPYWLSRFTARAARHFRLGFDHDSGNPCYPIRATDGSVLGIVRRQLDAQPKYLYPRGVAKSSLLFGYTPAARRSVVLVEGALDAVAAWEADHHAFGLYGSSLHPNQMQLILRTGVTRVIDALDNDGPGRVAVNGRLTDDGKRLPGLRARFERVGIEFLSVDWSTVEHKDLADCPLATRRALLDPLALSAQN